jgi:hypothetical protein
MGAPLSPGRQRAYYDRRIDKFTALAPASALTAIFAFREYTLAGVLTSYGTDINIASSATMPVVLSRAESLPTCRCRKSQKSS